MRVVWAALLLAMTCAGTAAAAAAPGSTRTSRSLYLSQDVCAGPGRLEAVPRSDTADHCGTLGLPYDEVMAQAGRPITETFTSTAAVGLLVLDGRRSFTGQIARITDVPLATGGVGTLTYVIHLTGTTTKGRAIDLGTVTVSRPAMPAVARIDIPFAIPVPAAARGQVLRRIVLGLQTRGLEVGMSAKKLSGDSYLVVPVLAR